MVNIKTNWLSENGTNDALMQCKREEIQDGLRELLSYIPIEEQKKVMDDLQY